MQYETPNMEIIHFSKQDDVITASGEDGVAQLVNVNGDAIGW